MLYDDGEIKRKTKNVIVFCPLHAAAAELLTEVKEECRMLAHYTSQSIRLAHLRKLITKAEGKTK